MLEKPSHPAAAAAALFGTAAVLSNFVYVYHLASLSLVLVIFNMKNMNRAKIQATCTLVALMAILLSPVAYLYLSSHMAEKKHAQIAEKPLLRSRYPKSRMKGWYSSPEGTPIILRSFCLG